MRLKMTSKGVGHSHTGFISEQQATGQKKFSRVYQLQNGTVELYTPIANHMEAIDWAQLSTSEIAKEHNDKSMEEIFINPKDAYNKLAVQPDCRPHTLAKRIKHLITPETTKYQGRRKVVAMSYDQENTQEEKHSGLQKTKSGTTKPRTGREQKKNKSHLKKIRRTLLPKKRTRLPIYHTKIWGKQVQGCRSSAR
jgi:hypothetical protein